jgi:hypothetical protein
LSLLCFPVNLPPTQARLSIDGAPVEF